MPELPECERARALIDAIARGARITRVTRCEPLDDKVFVAQSAGAFERALEGATLIASSRRGKQLYWELVKENARDGGVEQTVVAHFHLGMTGAFVARGAKGISYYNSTATGLGTWPPRFYKVIVEFDNGSEVAYVDPRRFGRIGLARDVEDVTRGLGLDPSKGELTSEAFASSVGRRKVAIKTALMDQKLIAGLGNWMADEILYRARVHPESRANELSATQTASILERIHEVVRVACEANSDHELFPKDWLFHSRWGKTAGAEVNGDAISFIEVGGRTTAFVPRVQLKTEGVPRAMSTSTTSNAAAKRPPRAKRRASADEPPRAVDAGSKKKLSGERATPSRAPKAEVRAKAKTRAKLSRAPAVVARTRVV